MSVSKYFIYTAVVASVVCTGILTSQYDVTVEGDKDDAVLSFMRLVKL
jgi:hypothetical protein